MRAARAFLLAGLLLPAAASARGFEFRTIPVVAESGLQDGGEETRVAWTSRVRAPGAAVIRVRFAAAELGRNSWLTIRSLGDGAEQRLDARSLVEWGHTSAFLNGEEAEVALHVAPGDRDVYVRLAGVMGSDRPEIETQCGATDDRVATTDNRVARVLPVGCTAWRIGNGAFLTAGHCADLDPDLSGPLLPDGTLDFSASTVIEFNVPASDASGNTVAAAPQDQYAVVLASVQWSFAGTGLSMGNDWCVFRVSPNSNTGLLPHQAYGLPFRIMRELPSNGATLRVTGFGLDTGAANQTNQTATGPFNGEVIGTGTARLDYRVDTEGGNSGSPVIWEQNQFCMGIHTNGGCDTLGNGNNSATSFELDALENAINAAPGANTIYVDSGHTLVLQQEGSLLRPIWTISGGISTVATGGRISVWPGNYAISAGTVLSKAMTIEAPVGTVTIAP